VRYPAREWALGDVLRDVESAAASAAPAHASGEGERGRGTHRQTAAREARPAFPVSVAHSMPGRLRLHLPGLARRPDAAEALAAAVRKWDAVRGLELCTETDSLVLRCDPGRQDDQALAVLVRHEWKKALSARTLRSRHVPSRYAGVSGARRPHPLLFPTLAGGLAARQRQGVVRG